MDNNIKNKLRSLSQRSWLLYKASKLLEKVYGLFCAQFGGLKVQKHSCVRLNKYVIGGGEFVSIRRRMRCGKPKHPYHWEQ